MMQKPKTAILIDGGFFMKRYRAIYGYEKTTEGGEEVAKALHNLCLKHLKQKTVYDLHRILYYDCEPYSAIKNGKKTQVRHPIRNEPFKLDGDFYTFKNAFLTRLKAMRKVAVRLGSLSLGRDKVRITETKQRSIRTQLATNFQDKKESTIEICFEEGDIELHLSQKGVDMKIGLDIASLAYKEQVDQIILISGDSDFVPAAKLARREGIDFILDPMWNDISPDLHEHIDGLRTTCKNPNKNLP